MHVASMAMVEHEGSCMAWERLGQASGLLPWYLCYELDGRVARSIVLTNLVPGLPRAWHGWSVYPFIKVKAW